MSKNGNKVFADAAVKHEVPECHDNDHVPSNELYIEENSEGKGSYSDSMEKTDYNSFYGANPFYNR